MQCTAHLHFRCVKSLRLLSLFLSCQNAMHFVKCSSFPCITPWQEHIFCTGDDSQPQLTGWALGTVQPGACRATPAAVRSPWVEAPDITGAAASTDTGEQVLQHQVTIVLGAQLLTLGRRDSFFPLSINCCSLSATLWFCAVLALLWAGAPPVLSLHTFTCVAHAAVPC